MTTTAHTKCHACGARLFSVTFTAGKEAGEFEHKIEIATDLASGTKAACLIRGSVETGALHREAGSRSCQKKLSRLDGDVPRRRRGAGVGGD